MRKKYIPHSTIEELNKEIASKLGKEEFNKKADEFLTKVEFDKEKVDLLDPNKNIDLDGYVTKPEFNTALDEKVSYDDLEVEANRKVDKTEYILDKQTILASKNEVNELSTNVRTNYVPLIMYNEHIVEANNQIQQLYENKADKIEVVTKVDKTTYNTDKATFATKNELNTAKTEVTNTITAEIEANYVPLTRYEILVNEATTQIGFLNETKANKSELAALVSKTEYETDKTKYVTKQQLSDSETTTNAKIDNLTIIGRELQANSLTLNTKVNEIETDLGNTQHDVEILEARVNNLAGIDPDNPTMDLTEIDARVKTMTTQIATIQAEQITQNTALDNLRGRDDLIGADIVSLTGRVETNENNIAGLQTSLTNLTNTSAESFNTVVSTLTEQATALGNLNTAVTVNKTDIGAIKATQTNIQGEVALLKQASNNNLSDIIALETNVNSVNNSITALEEANTNLDAYAKENRRLLGTQATAIDRINVANTNNSIDITQIKEEQVVQNNDIANIKTEQVTQNNDISSLKESRTSHANQIAILKGEQDDQRLNILSLHERQVIVENKVTDFEASQNGQAVIDLENLKTSVTNLQNNKWQIGGTYTNASSSAALTLTSEDNPCYFEWKSSNKRVLAIGRDSSNNKNIAISGNTTGWNNTQTLNISNFTWLNITCPVSYSQPIKTSSHIKTGAGNANAYIGIFSDQIDMVSSANSASFIAWAPRTGDGTRGNVYAKLGVADYTNNIVLSGNDGGNNNQLFISHWGKVNIRNNAQGVAIVGPIALSGNVTSDGPITSTGKVTMNGGAALNGTISVGNDCPDLAYRLAQIEIRLANIELEINRLLGIG